MKFIYVDKEKGTEKKTYHAIKLQIKVFSFYFIEPKVYHLKIEMDNRLN